MALDPLPNTADRPVSNAAAVLCLHRQDAGEDGGDGWEENTRPPKWFKESFQGLGWKALVRSVALRRKCSGGPSTGLPVCLERAAAVLQTKLDGKKRINKYVSADGKLSGSTQKACNDLLEENDTEMVLNLPSCCGRESLWDVRPNGNCLQDALPNEESAGKSSGPPASPRNSRKREAGATPSRSCPGRGQSAPKYREASSEVLCRFRCAVLDGLLLRRSLKLRGSSGGRGLQPRGGVFGRGASRPCCQGGREGGQQGSRGRSLVPQAASSCEGLGGNALPAV